MILSTASILSLTALIPIILGMRITRSSIRKKPRSDGKSTFRTKEIQKAKNRLRWKNLLFVDLQRQVTIHLIWFSIMSYMTIATMRVTESQRMIGRKNSRRCSAICICLLLQKHISMQSKPTTVTIKRPRQRHSKKLSDLPHQTDGQVPVIPWGRLLRHLSA